MDSIFHFSATETTDDTGFASPASLIQLVSLPRLALQLTRACHQPLTDYSQLCNLLQYDPALTLRYLCTLQALNHGPQPESISARIAHGNKALLSRTLLCGDRFDEKFAAGFWDLAERFMLQHWLESVQCAFLARGLARVMELPDSDDVFFAGLLYRCGELALLAQERQDYLRLISGCSNDEERRQQELAHYQTQHMWVSQRILKMLDFPHAFRDATLYYHLPPTSLIAAHPVTRIVYVAHRIVTGQVTRFGEAVSLTRQLLDLQAPHIEVLLESALNQAQEIQESLALHVDETLVRQTLLPALPAPDAAANLQSDLEQLRVERIALKNILSAASLLDQAADLGTLQEAIGRLAYLLFGCRHVMLFRHQPERDALQGENSLRPNAFENLLRLPLKQSCLPTDCFRHQQPVDNFRSDPPPPAVVDLELMQLSGCQSLVALPLTLEQRRWGCMVLAFEPDIQNRFNMLQRALQFFAQQVQQALERRDQRMHWQQELAQFERKLFEHRLKRIAHEVNNPLSIAQNHLHIVQMNEALPANVRDHVETVIEQIEGSSRILQAGIERLEGTDSHLIAVSINELIQDLVPVFSTKDSAQDDADFEFKTDLDESLPTIYIDDTYLRQVLINLIKNAMECCEDGGIIRITTRARIVINGRRHVTVQVQDDGPGIPDHQLETLFQPGPSSKEGRHAGIGLAIVKDLVEEMGGLISFQRSEDEQSTFSIYLPIQ
ncbi:MAG TPA: ATP-binding protein [Dongiaceae bacterium]|nr:ATP-binding protein [Dongiaceae bacterium]